MKTPKTTMATMSPPFFEWLGVFLELSAKLGVIGDSKGDCGC